MRSYRELVLALRELELDGSRPVIAHASLKAFGQVTGGAKAVLGALLEDFETVIMPTFTYKTMIIPEDGPPNNAIEYGTMEDANRMAEFFRDDMPADKLMGVIAETLRQHSDASRSKHPILSFSGINAKEILDEQEIDEPLAPISALAEEDGWVLLLGVSHKANTSIHLGECLAGRKTFVRWALMSDVIVECPDFPSCSDGFDHIRPWLAPYTRSKRVGNALVQAMPMRDLIETVRQLVRENPLVLLCERPECPRCKAVRDEVRKIKQV
jgi:aminoglycoside 3-N-acetyltransferase